MRKESNKSYTVMDWMWQDLELKGADLIVYANIYQFTQSGGEQKYTGGYRGLEEMTGLSTSGVRKALLSLEDKGLIIKDVVEINNVVFNHYSVDISHIKGAGYGKE